MKVRVSVAEAARPFVQVIVLATSEHGPAGPVWVERVVLPMPTEGKVSVMTSGFAVVSSGPAIGPGPLLRTETVQVTTPPC